MWGTQGKASRTAERKATAGKGAAKRAKVRGHGPQEVPRTSGRVGRSERSKKRRHKAMTEI